VRAVDFGVCPECAGKLSAQLEADGSPSAALHTLPTCARFDRMEAGEFLRWVMDVRDAARRTAGEA